jgi:hypothetical protein
MKEVGRDGEGDILLVSATAVTSREMFIHFCIVRRWSFSYESQGPNKRCWRLLVCMHILGYTSSSCATLRLTE